MKEELNKSIMYLNKTIGKKTGFSTPNGYFNDIENQVQANINFLNIKNEKTFDVPENYFNNLEYTILNKVNNQTKVITFKTRIFKLLPIATAASILLFFGLQFYNSTNKNYTVNFEVLAEKDIENWLNDKYTYIDINDVASVFNEDDFDENDLSFTNINNKDIDDYFDNIDNISLYNELN